MLGLHLKFAFSKTFNYAKILMIFLIIIYAYILGSYEFFKKFMSHRQDYCHRT